jgi:hypothetical protein
LLNGTVITFVLTYLDQEIIMEANAFTGTCECNSTYNGNPVGENFSTEKVVFDRRLFKADMGAQFVQIIYPAELDPGTHDLVFVSEGVPQLQYHNGKKLLTLTGTGKVTIGPNLDTQVGRIDANYFDDIGRLIAFKGEFTAKYELK